MLSERFTVEYLETFFEDNFIEDDELFDFLLNREGSIEEASEKQFDDEEDEDIVLIIKIKMKIV